MIRYLGAHFGEPRFDTRPACPLYLSTVGGLLTAFAVSCSSATPNSGPGAESGSTGSSAGGSGGTAGVQSGAGSSTGSVTSGSAGSSVAGSASGSSSGGANSGGSGAGGGSSGGGTSGGSGGSGTSGGGSDGGAGGEAGAGGGCAGKTYKLCEDFESGAVGGIPTGWTTLRGFSGQRGGVGLASDQFHSGSMSLKSDAMNTGQDRVEKSLAGLGATATKHWGRIFYKVGSPAPKPNSGVIHITFTALQGTTENRVVDTVVATNGTHQWLFNIPDDSCCTSSSYNWTFDASWHCAEWNIDVAAESFHFYSDSQEVTQLAFTGRAGARMSNYTNIGLGTIFYQTPPSPVVVWFDDLAIDDNQIGCQ
jgi:hypothetical protein